MKQNPIISGILSVLIIIFLGLFMLNFFQPLAIPGLSDQYSYFTKLVIVLVALFGMLWCMHWYYLGKEEKRSGSWIIASIPISTILRRLGFGVEMLLGYLVVISLLSWLLWKYAKRYYAGSNIFLFISLQFFGSLLEAEYSQALIWQYGKRYLRLDEIR